VRGLSLGFLALTLCSCGGSSTPAAQPSAPKVLNLSLSRASLVLNQKLPAAVSLADFQFQVIIAGQVFTTLPGNTPSTTVRFPATSDAMPYNVNLLGPAGFILSTPCQGTSGPGSVVCSGQIVDTRAVCDDTIINFVYKVTERLTVTNKCVAAIMTLAEVSDSDEDDSDQEAHGVPDPRFSSLMTPGNATMNGWLVLEAVCMGDVVKNGEAIDTCNRFKANYPKTGPAKNLVFPTRGGRAVVVGISMKDGRHANWGEIHGISYIFPIPDDTALQDFMSPSTPERKP